MIQQHIISSLVLNWLLTAIVLEGSSEWIFHIQRIIDSNLSAVPIEFACKTSLAKEEMWIHTQKTHRQLVCAKCVTTNRNSDDAHVAFRWIFKGFVKRGLDFATQKLNCACRTFSQKKLIESLLKMFVIQIECISSVKFLEIIGKHSSKWKKSSKSLFGFYFRPRLRVEPKGQSSDFFFQFLFCFFFACQKGF